MQISYHSALTKIQKLQNLLKKKKENFFFCTGRYCPKLAGTVGTRPVQRVFFLVRNKGVIHTGLRASTIYFGQTGRYDMELTPLL